MTKIEDLLKFSSRDYDFIVDSKQFREIVRTLLNFTTGSFRRMTFNIISVNLQKNHHKNVWLFSQTPTEPSVLDKVLDENVPIARQPATPQHDREIETEVLDVSDQESVTTSSPAKAVQRQSSLLEEVAPDTGGGGEASSLLKVKFKFNARNFLSFL